MSEPNDAARTGGGTALLEREQTSSHSDTPWRVILWNDPVNNVQYVTLTLMRVLEVDAASAERLMLQAHTAGRAQVASGTSAEATRIATALQNASLWATIEKGQA